LRESSFVSWIGLRLQPNRGQTDRPKLRTAFQFVYRPLRFIGVLGAVAGVTAIDYRLLHVNHATAAFSFLLLILALATRVGLAESITASLASVLTYNFFFLPPIGTLTIADPQNWVALFVFLATAITASQLSASARRKAEEAASREQEVHRMYEFSRALMLQNAERPLPDQIVQNLSELFGAHEVSFYDRETDSVHRIGPPESILDDIRLRKVAQSGEVWRTPDPAALIQPVHLGGRPLGSLGVAGNDGISEVALKAIAQLVAIAMERARAQDVAARVEAARQNEQLKSTLLDALAHEFKTPLTSIKAAATSVLSRKKLDHFEQDLVTVIDEETDHLNDLVSEAIELARIGAGPVRLRRELYSADELITAAAASLRRLREGRDLEIQIEKGLPLLEIDRRLIELALRQLLNNAFKYSPPSTPIRVTAGEHGDSVAIGVSNLGAGIPKVEQALVFEKFYRGREVRTRVPGTGMGLAIARDIIEAHGGRIWLESDPGKGVQFSFTLPAVISRAVAEAGKHR
jgi:two-component system sensor histidine kinase KdpD